MSEIILTSKYTMPDTQIKGRAACRYPEMKAEAGRRILLAAAPHLRFLFAAQPALRADRLCPLGATISPSNSFEPGIQAAFPGFSERRAPPKRQAACQTRGGIL